MKHLKNIFLSWIPFAVTITFLSLLTYGTVQQTIRLSANDPQVQMAQDAAANYPSGAASELLLSSKDRTDMAKTLSPFLIIYDSTGKPLTSGAQLNGQIPTPPLGVLENAKTSGENRVTWQPQNGVRIAAVIVPFNSNSASPHSGFILAGRSLKEAENLIDKITFDALIGWLVTMFFSLCAVITVEFVKK